MTFQEQLTGSFKLTQCISRVNDVAKYQLKIPQDRADHLRDAFSYAQLTSKLAVIKHLKDIKDSNTIILGQWHGMLGLMLQKFNISKNIIGIELDKFWHDFSQHIILEDYIGIHADVTQVELWEHLIVPDNNLIINTSCEHMTWDWLNFKREYTNGTLYVQSNNYKIDEHINILDSEEELATIIENHGFTVTDVNCIKFSPYDRYCVVAKWN